MRLEDRIGAEPAAYVEAVVARVRARLGARLDGVWLTGSAALGDFDPARSDVDVQAVTSSPPAPVELRRLAAALSNAELPCPARGLELVLYARAGLVDAAGPAFALNLNSGARMEEHVALDPSQEPRFWFVLDVAIARQRGLPLAGAPPAALLPELPRVLVAAALRDALAWYGEAGAAPAEKLLAACRAWAWASDGRWRSKAEAARWASGRLPDPGPVERALLARGGGDPLEPEAALPVVSAAHMALSGPGPPR